MSEVIETVNTKLNEDGTLEKVSISSEKELTPEERMAALKKEEEEFLNNPQYQQNAFILALEYNKIMGDKWFTLEKASKKTGLKLEPTFQKLKLLQMFGHCIMDKGDSMKSDERNEVVFRITITPQQKIDSYKHVIEGHLAEIAKCQLQVKMLEEEIKKSSVKEEKA